MTNRRVALISVTVSLLVAIGWQMALSSAHASRSPAAVTHQDSINPNDPVAPTWEYRILIFPSYQASSRPLGDTEPRFSASPPFLADEINKLATQGYVVDHFEIDPGYDIGTYGLHFSQIVVSLKRARK